MAPVAAERPDAQEPKLRAQQTQKQEAALLLRAFVTLAPPQPGAQAAQPRALQPEE